MREIIPPRPSSALCRLPQDGLVAGIVAGVCNYLQISLGGGRLLFCLLALFTGVLPLLVVYIALIFILPVGEPRPLSERVMRDSLREFERLTSKLKRVEGRLGQIESYLRSGDFEIDRQL